jgi:NTE family protein
MKHHMPLLLLAALATTACASTTGSCPRLPSPADIQADLQKVMPLCAAPPTACVVPPPGAEAFPFQNLVLQGGGVKGIAYVGAFRQLQALGMLDRIQRVAGTSAGAITGTLLALRYTPQEIQWLTFNAIHFQDFEDGGATGIFRIFRRFGWYKGDYFLHLMRCLVENKTGNPHSTFGDLQKGHFLDLHVFATDVSTSQSIEFSAGTTKDVEVARAVRMSMSIPLFFASVRFDSNHDVFVDGGVLRNYPIDTFDTTGAHARINPQTLGLTLTSSSGASPQPVPIDSLPRYAQTLFETLLDTQVVDLQTNPADLERTVLINDLGIPTTDFQINATQMCALIAQGFQCTCRYLRDWQPPGQTPISNLALGRATRIDTTDQCGAAWSTPPASRNP